MMLKRLAALFIALAFIFSFSATTALAASKNVNYLTFNTLDEITEDKDIFKTIITGKIDAVKKGKNWYYEFTRKGAQTVRIKTTAFAAQPKNTYLKADNDAFIKNLKKDSKHNYDRICYYNTMTSSKKKDFTDYTVSMYRFKLVAGGTGNEFLASAELTDFVTFTYYTKVVEAEGLLSSRGKKPSSPSNISIDPNVKYVTPSNSEQYLAALKRSSSVKKITPVIEVAIANTGSNSINLSKYEFSGKGKEASSKGSVESVFALSKLGKSAVACTVKKDPSDCAGAFKSAVEVMKTLKYDSKSKEYNTGKQNLLSKDKTYRYQEKYTSPITLSSKGDYTQIVTYANDYIGSAKFEVAFSFK